MADPSTLIARALQARGVYPSTRLPLGAQALERWRARLGTELLRVLGNDYDLVPRGQHARLRNAAARALERTEVACDPTGAADEASVILSQVISLDGTVVVRRDLTDDIQRQLGVCPHCGQTETVVNPEHDLFACIDVVDAHSLTGLKAKGCGAQWRGARLGSPA